MIDTKLTVVMYHYVRNLRDSRYPLIRGLDLELFNEQLLYLKKNYNIVTMEDVIDHKYKGKILPKKPVLLTFDDAYIDHYTNVLPLLSSYNIQGSFYVPVMAVVQNKVLDVNKIHFILAAQNNTQAIIDDLKELIARYQNEYNLLSFEDYFQKLALANEFDTKEIIFIKRLLQVELQEDLRNKIVDELFIKYVGVSEEVFSKELYMSTEQLKHMVKSGMHIGSHGYNHYWWNRLSNDGIKSEVVKSTDFLKSIGVDMNYFTACYPYGGYNEQAMRTLELYGCKLAFTTEVNIADFSHNHVLAIPRVDTNHIPKNRDAIQNSWFNLG